MQFALLNLNLENIYELEPQAIHPFTNILSRIMPVSYGPLYNHPQDSPFDDHGVPNVDRRTLNTQVEDTEPFSLVDEVEFCRRFREIAMMADDESDDMILLQPKCIRIWFFCTIL